MNEVLKTRMTLRKLIITDKYNLLKPKGQSNTRYFFRKVYYYFYLLLRGEL